MTEAILTSLISTEKRALSHCLQRLDACTAVKNSVLPTSPLITEEPTPHRSDP